MTLVFMQASRIVTSTSLTVLTAAMVLLFGTAIGARADVGMQFVTIGDPGNPADQKYGSVGPWGAVDYVYSIGKYEVTLTQYVTFLNAVAATDTYGLYNPAMTTNVTAAGIARSGASGAYQYAVIGTGNRPVSDVSWFDAARFVNWMQNGQPSGLQTASTTETGAYTLNGVTSGLIPRNADAQVWLPSWNEWYKAAFYQPASAGGDSDGYWYYPTKSNLLPNSRNGSTSDPNSANIYRNDGIANGFNGGYAVSNSTVFPTANALTAVGAFTQASSYYGTFDQAGNVVEWTDSRYFTSNSMFTAGGYWRTEDIFNSASTVGSTLPTGEGYFIGFRVAAVPEPNVLLSAFVGFIVLVTRRERRRA